MTPEQRDIIAAGIAVRGWPQPYRILARTWESAEYITWLWPTHPTCPAMYRNEATGDAQEMFAGMLLREDDDAADISSFFTNVDQSFDYSGFNPATGTFHKGL